MLSRISHLKKEQLWQRAETLADEEFHKLVGAGSQAIAQLSETELLARLIQGEPTQVIREKTLMLVALFSEAGDIAAAQERSEESRACYLKGLNLLLDTLVNEGLECPTFVPKVETFLGALAGPVLPLPTQIRLMQHFEQLGEFAKAEDALFAMLDTQPEQPGLREFGMAFYQRLLGKSDAALAAGNLPRPELETGLAELRHIIST